MVSLCFIKFWNIVTLYSCSDERPSCGSVVYIIKCWDPIQCHQRQSTPREVCLVWRTSKVPLFATSGRTSYRKISWSLEAARSNAIMVSSFWDLTDISAALLPSCLTKFTVIYKVNIKSCGIMTNSCGRTYVRSLVGVVAKHNSSIIRCVSLFSFVFYIPNNISRCSTWFN